MSDKAPWISYRPELKVLDCTIRDGGLINNSNFSDEQVRAAHLEPIDDVTATIGHLVREQPDARIAVLPQGPQTIAYVA